MRKLFDSAICLLLATLLLAVFPTECEGAIYRDTIRLHVLASSDTEADQTVKYEIRDRLLATYGERLSGSERTVAEEEIRALLPEISEAVNGWLTELGMPYSATVTLTEEWYETREYESFTLPSGRYTSLRVILGEGEGKNWWCVMYPPLCLDMATGASADDAILGYTDEEIRLITRGGYRVKFKLLEAISSLEKNR